MRGGSRNEIPGSKPEILAFKPGSTTSKNIVDELRGMLNAVDEASRAKELARDSANLPIKLFERLSEDATNKSRRVRIRTTSSRSHSKFGKMDWRTRGSTTGGNSNSKSPDLRLDDRTFSSEVKNLMKHLDDKALDSLTFRTPTFQNQDNMGSRHKNFFSNDKDQLSNIVMRFHIDDEEKVRILPIQSIMKKPKHAKDLKTKFDSKNLII